MYKVFYSEKEDLIEYKLCINKQVNDIQECRSRLDIAMKYTGLK
jgi:hypothetical protein